MEAIAVPLSCVLPQLWDSTCATVVFPVGFCRTVRQLVDSAGVLITKKARSTVSGPAAGTPWIGQTLRATSVSLLWGDTAVDAGGLLMLRGTFGPCRPHEARFVVTLT